ncbi:ZnF C2H2 [Geosmithia morbida]|uniref:ZnF C2H2 n=1 Tax=Geosmithia morbida TaxID=1094350 RepID=A0A9P5D200_9HYPO|nr:ZnF C2H2 [Geosmithia morbida]KAF4120991.1 ZnF C2H2 [Geosmithia morbida]
MLPVSHPTYSHQTFEDYPAKDQHYNNTAPRQQSSNNNLNDNSNDDSITDNNSNNFYSPDTPSLVFDDTNSFNPDQVSIGSMTADPWGGYAQYRQPEQISRVPHQRESSLSSLGSTGPASPYSQSSSNPRIALNEDEFSDMQAHDPSSQAASFYTMPKHLANAYSGYQTLDQPLPDMAYPVTISGQGNAKSHNTRSYPASVASSAAGDSPATPSVNGGDNDADRLRKGMLISRPVTPNDNDSYNLWLQGYGNVAKLDRTMTDVYGDDLYSPNFTITSTPPSQNLSALSPPNGVFNQRLSAANSQHMSVVHSPVSSGPHDRNSPFRAGSPFAASTAAHGFVSGHHGSINTAQRAREQAEVQQDTQLFRSHMVPAAEPETPNTISPKDAMLEFNETDDTSDFPLFPQNTAAMDMEQLAKTMPPQLSSQQFMPTLDGTGSADQFSFVPTQMTQSIPQQYPFISRPPPSSNPSPPRLSPSGHSSQSSGGTPVNMARPAGTFADGGTYTCTYHGCTMRFETPMQLQKHKREGHRQAHGLAITRPTQEMGLAPDYLNSQAGPHRCDRVNPNTGKPCHTVFSRPYDLTRHEDTIHNARKQKVRCDLCTEEKTFSRADALTRHYRVCHPDMELPGKVRRRGGV